MKGKRESSQELPQIESAACQQRVDSVPFLAFEVIASEPVTLFLVSDYRLDRIPAFEMFLQRAFGLVLAGDVNFDVFRMMVFSSVAAIDKGFFGPPPAQAFGLID